MTTKERFMQHVEIVDGHWMWTGAIIANNGYGKVGIPKSEGRGIREMTAHRRAYELFVGPIPEGALILHKHEGYQLCVRPEHLYVGDYVDNAADYRRTAVEGFRIMEKVRVRLEELSVLQDPESRIRLDELEHLL